MSYETMYIKRPVVAGCTFVTGKEVSVSVSSCVTFASGWNKDEDGMDWPQTMVNALRIPSIGL